MQATNKGKEEIKSLEKQMLKAHRKDVSSLIKGKKGDPRLCFVFFLFSCPVASGNLKDKEREIREKLVLKLKRKAESGVASQEGRVTKVRLFFVVVFFFAGGGFWPCTECKCNLMLF